jgi:hypothetical protein
MLTFQALYKNEELTVDMLFHCMVVILLASHCNTSIPQLHEDNMRAGNDNAYLRMPPPPMALMRAVLATLASDGNAL